MGASKELFTNLREKELTVNCTFKIKGKHLVDMENDLKHNVMLIDYRVVPDTQELYEKDPTFKKLVKKEKEAKKEKQDYINKNNNANKS